MSKNHYLLFELKLDETFSQRISRLTEVDLSRRFPIRILGRAYEYAEHSILSTQYEAGAIHAMILGTASYQTTIERKDDSVLGSCTCPHQDACKHLAALLIFLIQQIKPEDLTSIDA